MSGYESDDDPELAAALALSMQVDSPPPTSKAIAAANTLLDDTKPPAKEDFSDVLEASRKAPEPFDIKSFHQIMWDASTTMDSDKQRWVSQGIHVSKPEPPSENPTVADANANAKSSDSPSENTKRYDTILDQLADTYQQWGLIQSHGGPCGVLAVVQAELLRILIWGQYHMGDNNNNNNEAVTVDFPRAASGSETPSRSTIPMTPRTIRTVLAHSISIIVARATLTGPAYEAAADEGGCKARIVLPHDDSGKPLLRDVVWDDLEKALLEYTIDPSETTSVKRQKRDGDDHLGERIIRLSRAISEFLTTPWSNSYCPLDSFHRDGGVLLLTMAIVASRGKDRVQKEFDDSSSPRLTAQFGHCGQELMNVMLSGRAVSNVFDNTMNLGEMVCKGIHTQTAVGYLSQLESLRYCEVGSFLKSPKFAVWVCGSTSHFTVLFGDNRALTESKSDRLLETCQRAFKMVEGGEENGFIQTSQLQQVLQFLELDVGGESQVQTFAASLEVSGAGIILWDSFWKATSRLMTGATLENVLQGDTIDMTGFNDDLVGTEVTTPTVEAPAINIEGETDEQMARRMAREWSTGPSTDGLDSLQVAACSSPIESNATSGDPPGGTPLSDEALARKLQEEYNAEAGGTNSVAATDGSPPPLLMIGAPDAVNSQEDSKPTAETGVASTVSSLDFERFGDSFPLCHYNGLRGGTLTRLRVTRLSAVEAVGASTALNSGAQAGSGDLEDVVRTKYPSCTINWLGKQPPFID